MSCSALVLPWHLAYGLVQPRCSVKASWTDKVMIPLQRPRQLRSQGKGCFLCYRTLLTVWSLPRGGPISRPVFCPEGCTALARPRTLRSIRGSVDGLKPVFLGTSCRLDWVCRMHNEPAKLFNALAILIDSLDDYI